MVTGNGSGISGQFLALHSPKTSNRSDRQQPNSAIRPPGTQSTWRTPGRAKAERHLGHSAGTQSVPGQRRSLPKRRHPSRRYRHCTRRETAAVSVQLQDKASPFAQSQHAQRGSRRQRSPIRSGRDLPRHTEPRRDSGPKKSRITPFLGSPSTWGANCRNERSANSSLTAAISDAVNGSEETISAHAAPAMSSRPKTDQAPAAVSTITAPRIRWMNEGRSTFVSRQARTNRAGSGRTQAPTALRFTRATVSTKAVPTVANNTTPIVNGAVIIAVSAHASGCTPATTRLKIRVTATNATSVTKKPTPPTPTLNVQR